MANEQYKATGIGANLLPFKELRYLLVTDPIVGSQHPEIPDGLLNTALNNLLKNCSALADSLVAFVQRQVLATTEPAPEVGVDPELFNLTEELTIFHVLFQDFEVFYSSYQNELTELGRLLTRVPMLSHSKEVVELNLELNATYVAVNVPVGFEPTDLTFAFVENLDNTKPFIHLLYGGQIDSATIRFHLSETVQHDETYVVTAVFNKTISLP